MSLKMYLLTCMKHSKFVIQLLNTSYQHHVHILVCYTILIPIIWIFQNIYFHLYTPPDYDTNLTYFIGPYVKLMDFPIFPAYKSAGARFFLLNITVRYKIYRILAVVTNLISDYNINKGIMLFASHQFISTYFFCSSKERLCKDFDTLRYIIYLLDKSSVIFLLCKGRLKLRYLDHLILQMKEKLSSLRCF